MAKLNFLENLEFTDKEDAMIIKIANFQWYAALEQIKFCEPLVGNCYVDKKTGDMIQVNRIVFDYSHDLLTKGYNSEERLIFLEAVWVDESSINVRNKMFPYMLNMHDYTKITKDEFNAQLEKTRQFIDMSLQNTQQINVDELNTFKSIANKLLPLLKAKLF